MKFPPYVPEEVRRLYKQDLEENRHSPETAKRLEQYIFSPAMRDVYGWFSSVVESDIEWSLFYGLGEYVQIITPDMIEELREKRRDITQLKIDAIKTQAKIDIMEKEVLNLKKQHAFISNQINKCLKELDLDTSNCFENYTPFHLSKAMGREKNQKTESIRFLVSILYEAGFDMGNSKLKKAIATMTRILFDIDADITYDDVRKVMGGMHIPPWSFG